MKSVLAARAGRRASLRMPYVVVAAAAAASLWLGLAVVTIANTDFARFVWQADHLTVRDGWSWVNPFHPFGYPVALHVLTSMTGDHLWSARVINVVAAIAALAACWRIATSLHERMAAAVFGVIAVALSRDFVTAVRLESADLAMTAAGLWSVAWIVGTRTRARIIFAGAAAGLAYVLDFQGLVIFGLVVVLAVIVSGRTGEEPATGRYRSTVLLLCSGFLIVAAPQLIVSWVVTGNPIYSLQEINAGISVWGVDWHDFRRSTDAYTPAYLLAHASPWLARWASAVSKLIGGLGGLAVALVLPAWLLESTTRRAQVALFVAGAAFLYTIAVASGFYLPPDVLFASALFRLLIAGAGALWLTHARRSSYRLRVAVLVGATLAGLVTVDVVRDVRDLRSTQREHAMNAEISRVLHGQGLTDPAQVLTTSFDWRDTMDTKRRSFYTYGGALQLDPAWNAAFPRPEIDDLSSLDRFSAAHDICFLLLSPDANRVMPLIAASAAKASLAPSFALVWRDDARSIGGTARAAPSRPREFHGAGGEYNKDNVQREVLTPIALVTLAAIVLTVATPRAQLPNERMRAFLRDQIGFSTSDINAVTAGHAVAKQMKTNAPADVNIFGAVKINASADAYLKQLRSIDVYERKMHILQVAKFHDPPELADLNSLTLDADDIAALRNCQPHDCKIQLSVGAMTAFRQIDWKARDAADRANQLFRKMLFDILQTYRLAGSAGLGTYDDYEEPASIAEEFKILSAPGDLPIQVPALISYLTNYPAMSSGQPEDFFYWNKGEFGLKPTTRLNHVSIWPLAPALTAGTSIKYLVATKQIYSNHYFSSTLELRTIVDDETQPGKACYLLYTTKSRVTGLTGILGSIIRTIVRSKARSGMEGYLAGTKKAVEAAK